MDYEKVEDELYEFQPCLQTAVSVTKLRANSQIQYTKKEDFNLESLGFEKVGCTIMYKTLNITN